MRVAAAHSVENAFWTTISNALDAETDPGKAQIYSGTCPARGVDIGGGNTLIAEFTLVKPCAASIANGILTFTAWQYAIVLSTATVSFGRFLDGSDNWVMDVDCGVLNTPLGDGSLAAWQWDQASFPVGALIVPTSLTLKFPT